jgi:hypothetical protein
VEGRQEALQFPRARWWQFRDYHQERRSSALDRGSNHPYQDRDNDGRQTQRYNRHELSQSQVINSLLVVFPYIVIPLSESASQLEPKAGSSPCSLTRIHIHNTSIRLFSMRPYFITTIHTVTHVYTLIIHTYILSLGGRLTFSRLRNASDPEFLHSYSQLARKIRSIRTNEDKKTHMNRRKTKITSREINSKGPDTLEGNPT